MVRARSIFGGASGTKQGCGRGVVEVVGARSRRGDAERLRHRHHHGQRLDRRRHTEPCAAVSEPGRQEGQAEGRAQRWRPANSASTGSPGHRTRYCPLKENADKATVCVSGEFRHLARRLRLAVGIDLPILPRELQGARARHKAAAHHDAKIHVSTLAVSDNPMAHGADQSRTAAHATAPPRRRGSSTAFSRSATANGQRPSRWRSRCSRRWNSVALPLRHGGRPAASVPRSPVQRCRPRRRATSSTCPVSAGPIPARLWGFITGYLTGLTSYNTLLNIRVRRLAARRDVPPPGHLQRVHQPIASRV